MSRNTWGAIVTVTLFATTSFAGWFPAQQFPTGDMPYGVAEGDFDKDGHPDLVVINDATPRLMTVLMGLGDAYFSTIASYPVQTSTHALALSDFDRDGLLDVAVTHGSNPWTPPGLTIGLGLGGGVFEFSVYPLGFLPDDGIDAADFDQDGWIDLVVTGQGSAMLLPGQGDGSFARAVWHPLGASARSVTHADFDEDGWLDLAGSNRGGVTILTSRGDGTLEGPARFGDGEGVGDVDLADFNGDGLTDIATTNSLWNSVSVLLDQGDGTFVTHGAYTVETDPGASQGRRPVQAATADFNGDGNIDVVTANEGSADVTVLMGNGDGSLSAGEGFAVGSWPASIAVADLDHNTFPDIVTVNIHSDSTTVLRGRGDGRFVRRDYFAGYDLAFGTLGDFNGDTHPDLATVSATLGRVYIILGRGDGTFSPQWRQYFIGVGFEYIAVVDCDADGHEDLVTTNPASGDVMVLFGNGDGTFIVNASYGVATRGEIGSVGAGGNAHGDPVRDDVYVDVAAPPGTGDVTNIAPTYLASFPYAVESADIDNDGHVDLLTAGIYGAVTLLVGNGDGTFGDGVPYAASSNLSSLVATDFDRDGWTDIAAGGGTPGVAIMYNKGPARPSVEIDIKPDDSPNSINPRSRGVIPVAILGSDAFDVEDINARTLRFGTDAAPIAHKRAHSEDVNDDGFMDLVTHFRTQETGIVCGEESATLTGETFDGLPIETSDSIQTVGCRDSRWPGTSFDNGRRHEEIADGPLREIHRR